MGGKVLFSNKIMDKLIEKLGSNLISISSTRGKNEKVALDKIVI